MLADMVGPVEIDGISAFSQRGNVVVLSGWQTSRQALESLAELFRRAPENSVVQTVLGGVQRGFDLTPDSMLTHVCLFDDQRLRAGWYLLRRFSYRASSIQNHYRFTIELLHLGPYGSLMHGYEAEGLGAVSNDWNI